jgi:protein-S-isoprenylcysteine O-methyltransferase
MPFRRKTTLKSDAGGATADNCQKNLPPTGATLVFESNTTRREDTARMILRQGQLLGMIYLTLFSLWITSEVFLLVKRRATSGIVAGDQGFTKQALVVFIVTNLGAVMCLALFRQAVFATQVTAVAGLALMVAGLLLRWWAVTHLGRFFTVNVAVASDHRVIDTGPYRLIRHPSYTGILLTCLGVGLCFGNFASLLVIVVPIVALALKRVQIEEAALASELGEDYRAYMSHTKRLIPGVY